MDWIVSKVKPDFLGKRSFARADNVAARPQAARRPAAGRARSREGAQRVARRAMRPCDVELRQRRARPAVRARARRAAAASESARRSTRTASRPRSSTRCSTTRREHAVTAVLREIELDAQVAVRGEPADAAEHGRRRTPSGSARTSGSCSAAARRTSPTPGQPSTSPRTASASSSRARARPTCWPGAARSTSHPSVFPPGTCAQTLLARAQVILYRPDEHVFRLLVRPSFADYLCAWLTDAMA